MKRFPSRLAAATAAFISAVTTTSSIWSPAVAAEPTRVTEHVMVLTRSYDNARSGANLKERILSPSNVNPSRFGMLFAREVDGDVYAQPLYVPDVDVPGRGLRNLVYVVTMHNSVYAFDADDPAASDPVWHTSLIDPGRGVTSVPIEDIHEKCRDIGSEVGITGTPVIDFDGRTIFLVARTKRMTASGAVYQQHLHALDIASGRPRPASPVEITATVEGSGAGSVNGVIEFDPRIHNQRAGLLLAGGIVYIAWASHCDMHHYHGWIIGYDHRTLRQRAVFNSTPDGKDGGIWQSGQGLTADEDGYVYAVVGNGDDSAREGGTGFAPAVLKLRQVEDKLEVEDWFIPYNSSELNLYDRDLQTGAILLPGTDLLAAAGKQGVTYILNRNDLGRFTRGGPDRVHQRWAGEDVNHYGSPVPWLTADRSLWLYSWGRNSNVKAFRYSYDTNRFDPEPVSQGSRELVAEMPGGILSLSADGSDEDSGILWANMPFDRKANRETVTGILRAFDAIDLGRELWNSHQNFDRDHYGDFAKFTPATVVDGKVYVATFSGQLVVYGLLP